MKDILLAFVHVFAMMAPWLVFGFLMAGIIAVWIPRSWVNRMMGGSSGFRGILRAVAIGVPLPICSCGVLPIAAGLRKHGAGKGPTAALLISTPQTGHSLSAVHWASAAFLAAMIAYNLVRPVGMGHSKCSCRAGWENHEAI